MKTNILLLFVCLFLFGCKPGTNKPVENVKLNNKVLQQLKTLDTTKCVYLIETETTDYYFNSKRELKYVYNKDKISYWVVPVVAIGSIILFVLFNLKFSNIKLNNTKIKKAD